MVLNLEHKLPKKPIEINIKINRSKSRGKYERRETPSPLLKIEKDSFKNSSVEDFEEQYVPELYLQASKEE